MATACGKVILLGEHAVVYGRPCLAAGIDRGVDVVFAPGALSAGLSLEVSSWNATFRPGDGTEVGRALEAITAAMPTPGALLHGVLRASIHLPGTGGLGSSAALGVAIARALGPASLDRALTERETLAAALAWERVFHGNPSGVDHTMAARGGAGVFSKSEGFETVSVPAGLRLLIADTGERTPTRDTVAGVRRIWERRPAETEKTFDAVAALVRNGALALAANDVAALGTLMDLNQALLASLLLSTERTEDLCRAARESGALGAKLTGGGGGGCVLALAGRDKERDVLSAWAGMGAPTFAATVSSSQNGTAR